MVQLVGVNHVTEANRYTQLSYCSFHGDTGLKTPGYLGLKRETGADKPLLEKLVCLGIASQCRSSL